VASAVPGKLVQREKRERAIVPATRALWEDERNRRAPIDREWPAGYDAKSALRQCPTTDFICYDAVRPATAWMFAGRTGGDCLNWSYFHCFYCGLFAARTAPNDTII